uniref:Protein hunchback n=2 Tax=Platypeza consobrina TaxID=289242 RepID=B4YK69_9MUSC|nr:putative hunchback [Platypeza consobrina]
MQNWDALQPASYEHNWYSNMFQNIKQEPQSQPTSQLEQYLTMKSQQHQQHQQQQQQQQHHHHHQQQQSQNVDMNSLTPSPRADNTDGQSFFDHMPHPLSGFNPLTPPGLPNAVLPSMSHFLATSPPENLNAQTQSLTPRNTPPMDVTPPKSPKPEFSMFMDKEQDLISNSSDDTKFLESEDDENIRMPIYNSHGKMKNYKCKSCGLTAITKIGFWQHARTHMKPEKILQCPKCPFVTELKHHLEYHIRKHKNLKPFQCDKCSYSCVNKSMLNSHRKSHSSVYQYRCSDCDYATKYCHSFKLHLRKYDHKPGMVLDEEGLPNPSIVIDVYGTRRGPKVKNANNKANKAAAIKSEMKIPQHPNHHQLPASPAKSTTSSSSDHPNQQQMSQQMPQMALASILQQGHNMPSFFPYWNLNLQMLAAQQQVLAQMSPRMREATLQNLHGGQSNDDNNAEDNHSFEDEDNFDQKSEGSAMDLSQGSPLKNESSPPVLPYNLLKMTEEEVNTPTISSSSSSRRKGRVLKLDTSTQHLPVAEEIAVPEPIRSTESPSSSSFEEPKMVQSPAPVAAPVAVAPITTPSPPAVVPSNSNIFECKYCDIYFKDAVLYTIHMGYHSCDDVFKCNMCGEKCDSPVGLFVHMARNPHS